VEARRITLTVAAITVWIDAFGVPERCYWDGKRYEVTDTPTRLDFNLDAVTHLPALPAGWQFQGTSDDGESLIFDVVSVDQGQQWRILHTYR
jgi:hypothetical protein